MRGVVLLSCMLGLASLLYGAGNVARPMRALAPPQHPSPPVTNTGKLTEQNKLEILRQVDGEYAKVVRPLPSLKPGFRLKPTGKVNQQDLEAALGSGMPAANPGDTVQITGIDFHRKSIRVNINGGSKPHESWRNRIHLSVDMPWPTSRVVQDQPPGLKKIGSTLILEFGGPVPNITAAQLKKYLSPFLSFAGQRSAAQIWVNTLAPKFQKAIEHHQAIVGMDRNMVLASLGRPEHKVREFKENGVMTEDWIYGRPPGTTIFVTFIGNEVVRVKQFP